MDSLNSYHELIGASRFLLLNTNLSHQVWAVFLNLTTQNLTFCLLLKLWQANTFSTSFSHLRYSFGLVLPNNFGILNLMPPILRLTWAASSGALLWKFWYPPTRPLPLTTPNPSCPSPSLGAPSKVTWSSSNSSEPSPSYWSSLWWITAGCGGVGGILSLA